MFGNDRLELEREDLFMDDKLKTIIAILLMFASLGMLIIVAIGIYNDNLLETITGMFSDSTTAIIGLLIGGALSGTIIINELMSFPGDNNDEQ